MDNNPAPEPDLEHPEVSIWVDDGFVSMVIRKATVIENEGELVPGLALNPYKAVELAETLLGAARKAMLENEEE